MNYLIESLLAAKQVILSKKLLFLGLFLLQLLFVGLVLTVSAHYQILIFADLQGVIVPLQEANLDQASLEAGNLAIKEMLPLLQSYNSLVGHARAWVIWLIILFLAINSWIWLLSFNLIRKTALNEL